MTTTTPAPISSADATTALQQARTAVVAAEATLAGLLTEKAKAQEWADREKLATLRPQIAEAEDELAIAKAGIPRAEVALAEASEREDQVRRKVAYDAAIVALDAAEEARVVEYPSLAHRIREIVKMQAEVDLDVDRVNAALPAGMPALVTLRERYAAWCGLPREDIQTVEVERWVVTRTGQMLADEYQGQVTNTGNGYGTFGVGLSESRVQKRRFQRIKFLPSTSGQIYDGFANVLTLPGLPEEPAYYVPAFSDAPHDVLDRLRELEEREAAHRPSVRTAQYRYEEIPSSAAT